MIRSQAMASKEFQLVAQLMRRAGFGASREELDALVERRIPACAIIPDRGRA